MTTSQSVKWALREPMANVGFALNSGLFPTHQGDPWMTSMADLDAMSAELVDGLSHHVEYKLPVVLQQRGRAGEARACVKAELDRLSDATHLKAQQYRAFAEEFFQELHDGDQPG